MAETEYYLGFEPVEAMQWTNGTNGDGLAKLLGHGHYDWTNNRGVFLCYGLIINPNQWVVKKRDGKIIVQDNAPGVLKYWTWGAATSVDQEPEDFSSEDEARNPGKKWSMGLPCKVYKKPTVQVDSDPKNIWVGPWELVS